MSRQFARKLAKEFIDLGKPLDWFEALYAQGDPSKISWADLKVNPNFEEWLVRKNLRGDGKKALKVGCGLGDDAERLAELGFEVTAFDNSPAAIGWCKKRFPETKVQYLVHDLFCPPSEWKGAFDFVLESYTLQVLTPDLRERAIQCISTSSPRGVPSWSSPEGGNPKSQPEKCPGP